MIKLIEQLQQISKLDNLKLAPKKSFYRLITVIILEHKFKKETIKPIHSKVEATHNLETPTNKSELMRFKNSMNFNATFLKNLHNSFKQFYFLIHDDDSFL